MDYLPSSSILVLGCGAVGLNTALRLQLEFPNAKVTIMAKDFVFESHGQVDSGLFLPSGRVQGPDRQLTLNWIKESWRFYEQLRNEESAKDHGIFQLPSYQLRSSSISRKDLLPEVTDVIRPCSQKELDLFRPTGKWISGNYFHSIMIETDKYLPYAFKLFESRGGLAKEGKIDDLRKLKDSSYDVIVNCTGTGSELLCDDSKISNIREQVVRVKAPWIKLAVFADDDISIVPGVDLVTLSGSRQFEDRCSDLRESDRSTILQKAISILPNLEKAEIVNEASGIRAHRSPIRVEKELLDGRVKVVHHYGHGTEGVLLSPGSAETVVRLVQEILEGNLLF